MRALLKAAECESHLTSAIFPALLSQRGGVDEVKLAQVGRLWYSVFAYVVQFIVKLIGRIQRKSFVH